MTNETKIISDSAPMLLYNLIDCTTYGQLKTYLEKLNVQWELTQKSYYGTRNTIKINYKGQNLFYDFEIVKH
jgi:hypothetical protein